MEEKSRPVLGSCVVCSHSCFQGQHYVSRLTPVADLDGQKVKEGCSRQCAYGFGGSQDGGQGRPRQPDVRAVLEGELRKHGEEQGQGIFKHWGVSG